jgi:hypothetical protein
LLVLVMMLRTRGLGEVSVWFGIRWFGPFGELGTTLFLIISLKSL